MAPERLSGTERRVCSVLFVDLVGFTPFSQDRDPEDVRELLLRYFDAVRTVVARYGGVVEQFIGDAVVALWGAPRAHESDAERAIRAALDVLQTVEVLGGEMDEELSARAGVVTGEVAVSFAADGGALVAGDAVNTAARIQAEADPGCVLVDEATRRLTASAIAFSDSGVHTLKGKSEPAQLWRAIRVVSGLAGSQRPVGLEAPLCGRVAELRTLKELFHGCVEKRQPRLILVSGPAGVGKSRLGWELEKYVDGLAAKVLWHHGRCSSYGDGVAFSALAEMVRQRFGVAEEDANGGAARKLEEGLARLVVDPSERSYIGIRLSRLLGTSVEGDPGTLLTPDDLFAGWRAFFQHLAEIAPVVLVVEDAHHADPALLDFLDYVIDWASDVPLFVVVLARVEIAATRADFGSGRNRTPLSLAPLNAEAMGTLLEGLVPGLPSAAASAVADQAQGLPLFAVETVRSLVDRGVLVAVAGNGYEVAGDLAALAVPDTLHGLLAARLDALDQDVRSLVADASVLGTIFSAEALIAVSGRAEAKVRAGLAELVKREVLHVSADKLSPQRGDYRFAQEMLRQVARSTLSRRDRKVRHLAIADYLRSTFADDGEEVMDVVARHYLDALQAVPSDADVGQIQLLAVAALVRAAEGAERAGALGRAAALFGSAAELHEQEGNAAAAARVWEQAAEAWIADTSRRIGINAAERARALHERLGDQRSAARARTLAGKGLRLEGRHREAREHLQVALALLRPEPATDTVNALYELACLEAFEGGSAAGELFSEALNLAQGLDVGDTMLSHLFVANGIHCWITNRAVEGDSNLREAAYLAERAGNTLQIADALANLAGGQVARSPQEAATHAAAAIDQARRIGNHRTVQLATTNLAFALLLLGRWDEAAQWLGNATEVNGPPAMRYLAGVRGFLHGLRGDTVNIGDATVGLAGFSDSENVQDRVLLSTARALVESASDRPIEALAYARAALAQVEKLGLNCEYLVFAWPVANDAAKALGDRQAMADLLSLFEAHPIGHLPPLLRAELALTKAHLAAGPGEAGSAIVETEFAEAVAAFRRAGSPWHLGRALADYGGYLAACGQAEAAGAALDEAAAIAERLGAHPLALRIASVRAGDGQWPASSALGARVLAD
jgi:class 3 adenylate cyclase